MKRLILLVIIFTFIPVASHAQNWNGILDPTRAIDWSAAGIPGGIPNRTAICATVNASTYGNGSTNATSGIQSALNSCAANSVVQLSAGTFLITGTISVPSNVSLRGQGANQTILNATGSGDAVITLGTGSPSTSASVSITGGGTTGSTSLTVNSTSGISVGKLLMLSELNDPSFVSINGSEGACTWCDGGNGWNGTRVRGQIVEVTSVSGSTVGISPGVYLTYSRTPLATPFSAAARYAGVEDLQVYANNTGYTSNFSMHMCAYCWVSGVEGNYSDGDQAQMHWSFRGEIVNSYFSNTYLHTGGFPDGDIFLTNKSSAMLIQNNILERLHASIMLNWGTAGNVISYNYLFGAFDSSGYNWAIGGIQMHGAHPQFNLIEGNIDPHFHPDSTWGSHSHNTMFRNWFVGTTKICNPLTGRGTVNCASGSHYSFQANRAVDIDFLGSSYNSVGNVIGSAEMTALRVNGTGAAMPLKNMVVAVCGPSPCGGGSRTYGDNGYGYSLGFGETIDDGSSGFDSITPYSTLLLHGDYSNITGAAAWSGTLTHTLPASFYLASKPSWWGTIPFPAVGPDVTGGTYVAGHVYAIPAKYCYEHVMGGTDGTNSPITFNAQSCYAGSGGGSAVAAPTGLTAVIQ